MASAENTIVMTPSDTPHVSGITTLRNSQSQSPVKLAIKNAKNERNPTTPKTAPANTETSHKSSITAVSFMVKAKPVSTPMIIIQRIFSRVKNRNAPDCIPGITRSRTYQIAV